MSSEVKPTEGHVTTRRLLAVVALGTVLVLVTYVTPLATVPRTSADLAAGAGARAWILSAMSVGLAAGLLGSGALGDALGRRRLYVVGLVLLALGSLGCAAAPDVAVFISARVLEGLGGASVLACGLALLAHGFPEPAERGRATAVWGASVGLGITAGVLLAAGLDIGTGWRETYAVVGVLALALVLPSHRLVEESAARVARRLDLAGVLTLAGSLTALVSALTQARSGFTLTTAALLLGAVVLLLAFVQVERRTPDPMLDLALLRSPGFLAATLGSLALGLGIIAMSSNLPSLVQLGLGGSRWVATGLVVGWSATSVATSLVVRRVRLPVGGPALIAVALGVVGGAELLGLGVSPGSSPWRLLPAMVLAGSATGVLNAVLGREAVAQVPPDRAAMGSGSNNTARYVGAAIGITVFSVLLDDAGSGTGRVEVVDGWSTAVLVAGGVTLALAVLIGLIGRLPHKARNR